MTETPDSRPEDEREQQEQVPPPPPEQPAEPPPATATRQPDGSWTLQLTGTREQMRQDMRGLTRAVAAALRTDGNGGESCPEQIGYTLSRWASEGIYA